MNGPHSTSVWSHVFWDTTEHGEKTQYLPALSWAAGTAKWRKAKQQKGSRTWATDNTSECSQRLPQIFAKLCVWYVCGRKFPTAAQGLSERITENKAQHSWEIQRDACFILCTANTHKSWRPEKKKWFRMYLFEDVVIPSWNTKLFPHFNLKKKEEERAKSWKKQLNGSNYFLVTSVPE